LGSDQYRVDDDYRRAADRVCPIIFVYGLAGLVLVLITIESAFRRRLADLVQWIAILLAIGGFLILIFQFFWVIVLAGAMITGFYMIVSNLRELFARQ
jgi:hypothetical protein